MARITFKTDVEQNTLLAGLESGKVSVSVYNSKMNALDLDLTALEQSLTDGDAAVRLYADNLVDGLVNGDIASLQTTVALLNDNDTTVGSVAYQIKMSMESIINGAGEAYDTLKELLDLINQGDTDLNGLITQLNTKVDNLVDGASENWNTLGKIETATAAAISDVEDSITSANSDLTTLTKSIPTHKIDSDLPISTDNIITLSLVPHGDIHANRAVVYSYDLTDPNNPVKLIDSIYTVTPVDGDVTGKQYQIDAGTGDLSALKGEVEYQWREIDNEG